ncbi:MAG: NnrU family protein [Pseudomonadota bacterium]
MAILIAGIVLWSITHLVPALAPSVRGKLVGALGPAPYKGLFSFDILLAIGLIVWGWKTASPSHVYAPPLAGSIIPGVLIAIAFVLIVASSTRNNIKRHVRHPQMTAVILWGTGHLLANGDSRSLVLFGGLTAWALLEILFINHRDGDWQKPEQQPLTSDLITIVVGALACAVLAHFHQSLFGVPAMASY